MSAPRRRTGAGLCRALLVATALLGCVPAWAGAPAKMPSDEKLQKLLTQRQEVVRRTLELDPAQRAAFEEVYVRYEREREVLARERLGLADDFIRKSQALSASDATDTLDRVLRLRQQELELDEKFRPQFAAVLSPQKVLLVYELNAIFDAVVAYDLAGMLPLAKE